MQQIYTLGQHLYERDGLNGDPDFYADEDEDNESADVTLEKSPAEVLRDTLHLGIMDEWGWKELDDLELQLGGPLSRQQLSGYFPYRTINLHAQKELIVIGPEGIVRRFPKPDNFTPGLTMAYINGDLLCLTDREDNSKYYWITNPTENVKLYFYNRDEVGITTPKGGTCNGYVTLTPGATRLKSKKESNKLFSDGQQFWTLLEKFDPDTGKTLIENNIPSWFAEKLQAADIAEGALKYLDYYPVSDHLKNSPLGVKSNQYGIRFWRKDDKTIQFEDISGNTTDWSVKQSNLPYSELPCAFIKFPERSSLYVILRHNGRIGIKDTKTHSIILPSGTRDLHDDLWTRNFENIHWWHYLSVRDPAGSIALANCSLGKAEALLQATIQYASKLDRKSFFRMRDFYLPEIESLLPEVTHPILRKGICKTLQCALLYYDDYQVLQKKNQKPITALAPDKTETSKSNYLYTLDMVKDGSVAALSELLKNNIRFDKANKDYEASLKSAERFFQDTQAAEGLHELTQSHIAWLLLSLNVNAILWIILLSGYSQKEKEQFAKAIHLWSDTEFARNPNSYRVLKGNIRGLKGASSKHYISGYVENGHHYVLFQNTSSWSSTDQDYLILEKSINGVFQNPQHCHLEWTQECVGKFLPIDAIQSTLENFYQNGSVIFEEKAAKQLATAMNISYPTAAIFYTASIFQEKTDASFLRKIKIKRVDEDLASWEISERFDSEQNLIPEQLMTWQDLRNLYSFALPPNPIDLYKPVDNKESAKALAHIIEAWKKWSGLRRSVDEKLIRQLKEDFQDPKGSYYCDVRLLENPHAYKGLTIDKRWGIRPYSEFVSKDHWKSGYIPEGWPKFIPESDETENDTYSLAFTGSIFKRFIKLISWAYLELPKEAQQRRSLNTVIELINKRLENPELLFLAGAINLIEEREKNVSAEFAELIAPFTAPVYKLEDNLEHAEGYDRGDLVVTWPKSEKNGIFISFRPSLIREPHQLEIIAKDLGIYELFKKGQSFCACGLNFGRNRVPDLTILPHYLLWRNSAFIQLLDSFQQTGTGYEANPQLSAPELVNTCKKTLSISEASAIYFLQVLSLPDPTHEKIKRYNNWDKTILEQAEKELINHSLIIAKEVTRSKRTVFIKSEIDYPSPPAMPLEKFKTTIYGLEYDHKKRPDTPYQLILPQKPMKEIFQECWNWFFETYSK